MIILQNKTIFIFYFPLQVNLKKNPTKQQQNVLYFSNLCKDK